MKKQKIIWDNNAREIVITQEKRINVGDAASTKEVKQNLEKELLDIVRQVKRLKARAEEIKGMLNEMEGAELTDPAPVLEPDPIPVQQKPKS